MDVALWKLAGERADGGELLARQVEVDARVLGNDLEDADFQHVSGLGFLDEDRTRQRVGAATRVCLAQLDDFEVSQEGTDLSERVGVCHRTALLGLRVPPDEVRRRSVLR